MQVTSEDDANGEAVRLGRANTNDHTNPRFRHEPRDSPVSRNDRRDNRDPDAPYSLGSDSAGGYDDDDDNEGEDFYDDDDDDEDIEGDDDPLPPPPPPSQNTFAPPFYGRPPTPLPPSPSLTSLLRPSRPTTPDASEDDGAGTGTGGGPDGASSRPRDPVPRARPKVPTYEYYGFVLYLFSSLSFLIYLLWSYLPSPFLHALGIYYYPNRWWSLAIPSWLVMLLVYIYVALAGYNTEMLTLPLGSVETVVDEAAMVAVVDGEGRIVRGVVRGSGRGGKGGRFRKEEGISAVREEEEEAGEDGRWRDGEGGLNWREVWNEGTDAVMDVPLAGVCEVLYGEGRDWDSDLEDDDVVITRV